MIQNNPYGNIGSATIADSIAPIHAMLAGETQERKEEIWNAVTSEITRYANDSTASLSLDNQTICAASSPRVKSKRKGISPMTLNFNQFIHGYACGHT